MTIFNLYLKGNELLEIDPFILSFFLLNHDYGIFMARRPRLLIPGIFTEIQLRGWRTSTPKQCNRFGGGNQMTTTFVSKPFFPYLEEHPKTWIRGDRITHL